MINLLAYRRSGDWRARWRRRVLSAAVNHYAAAAAAATAAAAAAADACFQRQLSDDHHHQQQQQRSIGVRASARSTRRRLQCNARVDICSMQTVE